MCDALHALCGLCRLRGHNPRDHRHFDPMSLVKIALLWSPGGLLTSIPLLAADPTFWKQPDAEDYYFDVYNRSQQLGVYKKNAVEEVGRKQGHE